MSYVSIINYDYDESQTGFVQNFDSSSEEDSSSKEVEEEIRNAVVDYRFFGISLHEDSAGELALTGGIHLFHGVKAALAATFGPNWPESSLYEAFRGAALTLLTTRKQKKLTPVQFGALLEENAGVRLNLRKFIENSIFKGADAKFHGGLLKVMASGVKYLNEEQRAKYFIEIGPVLQRQGKIFDTAELVRLKAETSHGGTFNTGRNLIKDKMVKRCMWVMTERGHLEGHQFYSHVGKLARFHHSSFSAGDHVSAAGEWYVEAGKILLINCTSGHYRPEIQQFLKALTELNREGALQNAEVQLFDSQGKEQRIDAVEFKKYSTHYLKNHSLF